jgi:hypothetical protein
LVLGHFLDIRHSSFVIVLVLATAACRGDELQAGAAAVDITPPVGLPMWGYGARHDKPSESVMDPLRASALVLAVGDSKLAIVGLDLGRAPTRKSMAAIRERIKADAAVAHVMIVGSHTHHGPVLEVDDLPSPDQSYVRELDRKIAEVIIAADKNRRPAQLGVLRREVEWNRNRQSKLHDKPRDRELAVVRVDDRDGNIIAIAVNFAAHPTMIPAETMSYSADYPGAMKSLVEEQLGGTCLFLQGASGDMSANPGEHRGHQAFGQALGREVVAMARAIKTQPAERPSIRVREQDFQFAKSNMRINLDNTAVRAVYNQAFFKSLVDFYVEEYRDGVRPHLSVALINNELGLVGASGEFFANHAVRLKQRSRLAHTLFFGYTNDYQQYFPTIEAAAEGGYGADPGVSPVELGAGEVIMNRALFHLYDMQGKFNRLPF